jgi:hypothetical protein
MSDEPLPLTIDQVRTAAAVGRLAELAQKLVTDERWSSLEVLLGVAATPTLGLEDATAALRGLLDALAQLPEGRRRGVVAEVRLAGLHTANALARRADRAPLTARERSALRVAAGLFAHGGDLRRAAELFEKADDDTSAADLWGALGELERMEACLARDDERRQRLLRATDARRAFETLAAAGERRAALRAIAGALDPGAPLDDAEGIDVRAAARALEGRLCRGRGVSLRLPDGRLLRVAGAPAVLGRDPSADVPLREPTVSRRHTAVVAVAGRLYLEDAGSRGGTRLAGAMLAGRVPLEGDGEIGLGDACLLRYHGLAPGVIELRGVRGLDRDLWVVVGADRVELGPLAPALSGLRVGFVEGGPRLERPVELALRLGGRLIGPACDLAAGDAFELPGGVRLEVA